MTDLRVKIISIACALALVAGCMPAVAFAQEESEDASPSPKQQANSLCDEAASSTLAASEDAPSPAPTRIPIDRQAFAQAEDEGITLQSVNLNATVAPHDAFSDEFLYFTKYESGNRLTSGEGYDMLLSAGDNYHAMGCYQFDNRYGLQDFLVACYNYSPTRYSMFAWLKDASVDISNMKLYDSSKKALTDTGKRLNNSWSAAYQANPEEFSRLQDGWFYQEYVEYALRLCNNSAHNFNMDSRSDCIKGLVSGICNLFGSGGMQFFVGGTLYEKHYDGAGLSGTMSDREFVTTLCNYIVDHVAELPYVNSQYVPSYQNRYRNELADCLAYHPDARAQQGVQRSGRRRLVSAGSRVRVEPRHHERLRQRHVRTQRHAFARAAHHYAVAPSGFPAGRHVHDRVCRRRLRQLLRGRHPMGARDRDCEGLWRQQ